MHLILKYDLHIDGVDVKHRKRHFRKFFGEHNNEFLIFVCFCLFMEFDQFFNNFFFVPLNKISIEFTLVLFHN